jgi:hypothetical protein
VGVEPNAGTGVATGAADVAGGGVVVAVAVVCDGAGAGVAGAGVASPGSTDAVAMATDGANVVVGARTVGALVAGAKIGLTGDVGFGAPVAVHAATTKMAAPNRLSDRPTPVVPFIDHSALGGHLTSLPGPRCGQSCLTHS